MTAPDQPADGPVPAPPMYGMRCDECQGPHTSPDVYIPASCDVKARDDQALDHAGRLGHRVTLYTQDERGTTITGHIDSVTALPAPVDNQPAAAAPPDQDPDAGEAEQLFAWVEKTVEAVTDEQIEERLQRLRAQQPAAAGRARPAPPAPPLVAFIARAGADPDLMCRIPPRAGAAWLLTAAHACALGRGSLGIQVAHRVMYAGRVARDPAGVWSVRIDGLLGATDTRFGAPVGARWSVDGHADITDVEDNIERLLSWEYMIPRAEFTVVLMSDAPVADPPDPHAEQLLREERLAARKAYRSDGRIPPLGDEPD